MPKFRHKGSKKVHPGKIIKLSRRKGGRCGNHFAEIEVRRPGDNKKVRRKVPVERVVHVPEVSV